MTSWRDVTQSMGRLTLLLFLLAAAFELLVASSAVKDLTIGPLSLGNTSIVQDFLPAIIAYFLYYEFYLSTRWDRIALLYKAILKRFYPKLYRSRLFLIFAPIVQSPWASPYDITDHDHLSKVDKFDFFVAMIMDIFVWLVLFLGFEIQAYYKLIDKYGLSATLVLISLALSALLFVLFLVRAYIVISESISERLRELELDGIDRGLPKIG